jgi:hypothetical protein
MKNAIWLAKDYLVCAINHVKYIYNACVLNTLCVHLTA